MHDNSLSLRAYIKALDSESATSIASQFVELMSRFGRVVESPQATPYWKMEGLWEISLLLRPSQCLSIAFDEILSALGTGWEVHRFSTGGTWAVWNPGPDSQFFTSHVRWANVECLKCNEAAG